MVRAKESKYRFDRFGDELDAEIVEIIDNPISISEAIVSPAGYKAFEDDTGKFESLTTEADQQLQQFAGPAVESIGRPATPPAPAVDTQRSVRNRGSWRLGCGRGPWLRCRLYYDHCGFDEMVADRCGFRRRAFFGCGPGCDISVTQVETPRHEFNS